MTVGFWQTCAASQLAAASVATAATLAELADLNQAEVLRQSEVFYRTVELVGTSTSVVAGRCDLLHRPAGHPQTEANDDQ